MIILNLPRPRARRLGKIFKLNYIMVRIKRGTIAHKRRKKVLKQAKGFRWGRKSKYRLAKEALMKAGTYAYRDRRTKKREFRRLWQIQINAACRKFGISYSKFIHRLKEKNIIIDRKVLAILVKNYPDIFAKIIKIMKSNHSSN